MLIDRRGDDASGVELNMTPMIDVVFNLLIFFLVGTRYAEIERDMLVNPPSARDVRPVTATPRELIVNVTDDGRFIVSGIQYAPEDLERLIARAAQENPDQAVVIRGDRRVVLQLPVNILSLCEKYAVKRTYLTTAEPAGP